MKKIKIKFETKEKIVAIKNSDYLYRADGEVPLRDDGRISRAVFDLADDCWPKGVRFETLDGRAAYVVASGW